MPLMPMRLILNGFPRCGMVHESYRAFDSESQTVADVKWGSIIIYHLLGHMSVAYLACVSPQWFDWVWGALQQLVLEEKHLPSILPVRPITPMFPPGHFGIPIIGVATSLPYKRDQLPVNYVLHGLVPPDIVKVSEPAPLLDDSVVVPYALHGSSPPDDEREHEHASSSGDTYMVPMTKCVAKPKSTLVVSRLRSVPKSAMPVEHKAMPVSKRGVIKY